MFLSLCLVLGRRRVYQRFWVSFHRGDWQALLGRPASSRLLGQLLASFWEPTQTYESVSLHQISTSWGSIHWSDVSSFCHLASPLLCRPDGLIERACIHICVEQGLYQSPKVDLGYQVPSPTILSSNCLGHVKNVQWTCPSSLLSVHTQKKRSTSISNSLEGDCKCCNEVRTSCMQGPKTAVHNRFEEGHMNSPWLLAPLVTLNLPKGQKPRPAFL